MEPISRHPDGVTVRILVVPGASRTEVKGRHGDAVKVRVAAPPEGGKANRAVLKLLEAKTGGRATLLNGAGSRRKIVLLSGTDRATVERLLDP